MPTEYECPGCGSSVLIPDVFAGMLGSEEHIGCNNTDEHDDGEPLVMWESEE